MCFQMVHRRERPEEPLKNQKEGGQTCEERGGGRSFRYAKRRTLSRRKKESDLDICQTKDTATKKGQLEYFRKGAGASTGT